MNIRFLDTFLTLVRLGNFNKTALALHLTPAAISLRIKTLEEALGASLIDRDTFALTPHGERLLPHARSVVQALRALELAMQDEVPLTARLQLGVIETVVHSWLPDYVRLLNAQYSNLIVDLTVDSSAVLTQRLRKGDLDLIIRIASQHDATLSTTPLVHYPMHWVAHRDLIPSRSAGQHRQAMLHHPILTFGRGAAPQKFVEAFAARLAQDAQIPPESVKVVCMSSVAVILKLLREGYGIAAVPVLFTDTQSYSQELVTLRVCPLPPSIAIEACYRNDATVAVLAASRAAQEVCDTYTQKMGKRLIKRC